MRFRSCSWPNLPDDPRQEHHGPRTRHWRAHAPREAQRGTARGSARRRARAAPSMPAGTFPEAVGRAGACARAWADEDDPGLVRLVRATKLMLPSPDVHGCAPVRAEHDRMLTFRLGA